MREIQAHLAYTKFSLKALEEGYSNIAYLFKSFAVAESIHGRNFRNALVSLGEQPISPAEKIDVLSTKENLGQAISLELKEIDIYYPEHIRTIKAEEHWNSITAVSHALASEKQHEHLLQKMKKGTGIFWSMLKQKIEGEDVAFFICQVCGSTLTEVPMLNQLYTTEWNLYINFFNPSVKLLEKYRDGSKIIMAFSRIRDRFSPRPSSLISTTIFPPR